MEIVKESVVDIEKCEWYAIYCIANQEKSIKTNIERDMKMNNLDNYINRIEVPTEKVIITSKGKKITREKILLSGYIFIHCDLNTNGEMLPVLRRVKGVIGFINPSDGKSRTRPEVLRESEVLKFLNMGNSVEVVEEKLQYLVNERVRITDGAFNSFEGDVQSIDKGQKTMKISVKIFSRETIVDVEYSQVEKVK
jgi:transcriptional antiterminator NusG